MENEETRFPQPFEAFLVIFAGVMMSIFPQYLVYTAFADPEAALLDPFAVKIATIIGEITLLAVPIIYLQRRRLSVQEAFRLHPVPSHILGVTALVGLSLVIVVDEIDRVIRTIIPMPEDMSSQIAEMLAVNNGLDLILIVLGAVILAALVEEFIFRGFLQQSVEKHMDVTRGVIYASVAWTAVHGSLYIAIQLFVFGFFLGWLAWRTRSVYPAILCHALNNAIAIWYSNIDHSSPLPVYEWYGHVSPIVLVLAVWVGYKGILFIDEVYRSLNSPLPTSNDSDESTHTG